MINFVKFFKNIKPSEVLRTVIVSSILPMMREKAAVLPNEVKKNKSPSWEGVGGGYEKYRIGNGYDIHRLAEGRKLILGGVEIPYDLGLLGHSDADVLTHAVMDAMLGAISLGDIGKHFPPSDPQYKDISSLELLKKIKRLLEEKNHKINNIDAVIQAEKPKLLNYIPAMREKLAHVLKIEIDQISVKATTMEGLGVIGEGKAIAVHAIVLLKLSDI